MIGIDDIERLMAKWQGELAEAKRVLATTAPQNRPKPWKKKEGFIKSDVVGKMHIILGDGVYVDALNLMPRIQNQIRSMAAFDNPIFYKNKRFGYSNYYNFSEIEDHREKVRPIRASFNGDLRTQQDLAAHRLLAYDHGVLSAATAFGSKNSLTGIIDVAMVGSVYSKGRFNEIINSYGMVLMDECHHCGSATSVEVMQKVNARYVYGVSATPKLGDNLEKIIYMLLGPVRHSYTAKERALEIVLKRENLKNS